MLGCCQLQLTSLCSTIVLQPPLLCEEWDGRRLCVSGDNLVLMDLLWPCDCTAQSSPSVEYLSFLCEVFSSTILDSSSFSLFHSGQDFHELVCPLTVVLPQIFYNLTTLFSYPGFFCIFHAPLEVVVHFLIFLRSFTFESFSFSVFSFCRTDQEFLQLSRVFSSDDVCQGSHWLFQSPLC